MALGHSVGSMASAGEVRSWGGLWCMASDPLSKAVNIGEGSAAWNKDRLVFT